MPLPMKEERTPEEEAAYQKESKRIFDEHSKIPPNVKPWQPLDEETLLGKEFLEARNKGLLGDDIKFRYREAWKELGAPKEWIARNSHVDPDDVYWQHDKHFHFSVNIKHGRTSLAEARAEKSYKQAFGSILQAVRDVVGGPSFHTLNLEKQCLALQIPYIKKTPVEMVDEFPDLKAYALGEVEDFALNYYKMQGWRGVARESSAIGTFTSQVAKYCQDRDVYYCGYTKAIVMRGTPIEPRKLGDREKSLIREAVAYCLSDLPRTYKIANESSIDPFSKNTFGGYIELKLEDFIATCHAYGEELLNQHCIAQMHIHVSAGHPDLTIYKDGKLAFVEVKQGGDKFTPRQPYWIKDFGKKLNYDISVLHIAGNIKKLA